MSALPEALHRMVDRHIAGHGVGDLHVFESVRSVPREAFVEPGYEKFAYEDAPLPIGEGQTISNAGGEEPASYRAPAARPSGAGAGGLSHLRSPSLAANRVRPKDRVKLAGKRGRAYQLEAAGVGAVLLAVGIAGLGVWAGRRMTRRARRRSLATPAIVTDRTFRPSAPRLMPGAALATVQDCVEVALAAARCGRRLSRPRLGR